VVGPIVASVFMRFIGAGGLFTFTALVHAGMIVFVIHRLRQRVVTPVEDHISFADAMRVGLTVSSVDSISHSEHSEHPEHPEQQQKPDQ
jgi:hypothetical protein